MESGFERPSGLFLRKKILWFYLAMVLIFGVILAYFILSSGKMITGLKVAGIKIGGLPVAKTSQALAFRLTPRTNKKINLVYNNRTLTVVPSAIGIGIDIQGTVNKAYQTGRTGPLWNRLSARGRAYRQGINIEPVFQYNSKTLESFYRLLDAIIAVEPIRSVIVVNRQGEISFTPSRTGRSLDRQRLTRLLQKMVASSKTGSIEIPIINLKPPLTENDISLWGLNRIMAIYSTQFDPGNADRVQNIKTACSALDNSLIYPGQSFSFNTWVGPRVTEAGYKEAQVIFMGKLVPGVGGGVCQVSSTLYNTVLLSNLKIMQRFNHSLPSNYVPIGRDATVVYGGIDFIFQNTNQNPILIVAKVESPFVTVAVLGAKSGWDKIALETQTIDTYPFPVKEIPDPELPKKTRVKIREGINGYKVELWREIIQSDGTSQKELVNTSIYPAQPEEYKTGTKK